jgi:glycerate kinase
VTLAPVVLAPDKFKGCLSATEAVAAMLRGLRRVAGDGLDVRAVPMADGGEGTVEAFLATGARRVVRTVRGPLGEPVEAVFALDGARAILEMAAASGLALVAPERRDPLRASSYGTGELIAAALDAGASRIVVGIGGSATNDGGAGVLQALGARLLDAAGRELEPGALPLRGLARIELASLDPRLQTARLEVAADVDNPLLGPRGASAIFGPQKGVAPHEIALLDAALARFADVAADVLGRDERETPGAGAAGGLGFGLRAFFGAVLRPGVELVAELRDLPAALRDAAWCFTGEGSIDVQTLGGKTVAGVARLARAAGARTLAFGGRVEPAAEEALAAEGVVAFPIGDGPVPLEEALRRAAPLLERAAARAARLIGSEALTSRPAP